MELEQKALPRTLWAEGCAPYRNYTITFASWHEAPTLLSIHLVIKIVDYQKGTPCSQSQ